MDDLASLINYGVLVFQVSFGLFVISIVSILLPARWGAPWIITSNKIIDRMLSLGNIQPGDKIADLGSGDGRILIKAAKNYEIQGFGVEIDPFRVVLSKFFIFRQGLHRKIHVLWGNIFDTKLDEVNLITMYLTREVNSQLKDYLDRQCNPGTRVVSYAFPIPGWNPIMIDDTLLIFVYEVGNTGDDVVVSFV